MSDKTSALDERVAYLGDSIRSTVADMRNIAALLEKRVDEKVASLEKRLGELEKTKEGEE